MIRCDGANALVLHNRDLPPLYLAIRGPLTVSLLAHRFPVFGRGQLQEDQPIHYTVDAMYMLI